MDLMIRRGKTEIKVSNLFEIIPKFLKKPFGLNFFYSSQKS